LNIQDQVDHVLIYPGQYFTIPIHENSFLDHNTNKLTYAIVLDRKENNNLPSWLTFSNLALKGTPPEDLFNRDFDLLINVTNQFKHTVVPFKLHIRISPIFALKLLIKNSPYILTFLGLIIYFNKIYNTLCKKRYRHPKDYFISIDQEITPSVIFPVMFIKQENQEKELILKYLPKTLSAISQSLKKNQVVSYFIDQTNGALNKTKIVETIQEAVEFMPITDKSRLSVYFSENQLRKAIIIQLVINTLVDWHLDQEATTKKIFNQLKDRCYEFVEYTLAGKFVINKPILQQTLEKKFSSFIFPKDDQSMSNPLSESSTLLENDIKGSLLNKSTNYLNINLLEDALVSLVFTHHTIYSLAIQVSVLIMGKASRNFIFTFLKKDLREIGFQDKGKLDYGFDYKIKNGALNFYGSPTQDFRGKTIVAQIVNRKQRILKEIWIHGGKPSQLNSNNSFKQCDHNKYEIL